MAKRTTVADVSARVDALDAKVSEASERLDIVENTLVPTSLISHGALDMAEKAIDRAKELREQLLASEVERILSKYTPKKESRMAWKEKVTAFKVKATAKAKKGFRVAVLVLCCVVAFVAVIGVLHYLFSSPTKTEVASNPPVQTAPATPAPAPTPVAPTPAPVQQAVLPKVREPNETVVAKKADRLPQESKQAEEHAPTPATTAPPTPAPAPAAAPPATPTPAANDSTAADKDMSPDEWQKCDVNCRTALLNKRCPIATNVAMQPAYQTRLMAFLSQAELEATASANCIRAARSLAETTKMPRLIPPSTQFDAHTQVHMSPEQLAQLKVLLNEYNRSR